MATYDRSIDLSNSEGKVQILTHGGDVTLHVPATGIHLTSTQAVDLAAFLLAAAFTAEHNRENISL